MDGTKARAVLGVPRGAHHKAIIRTFRERAFATHPDTGGDPAAFAQVLRARDVALSLNRASAPHGYARSLEEGVIKRRVWSESRPRPRHSSMLPATPTRSFGSVLDYALAEAGVHVNPSASG